MRIDPHLVARETPASRPIGSFATEVDHVECRRLHRKHGVTYYFATRLLPAQFRRRVHALYGFVRVPDQWVDDHSGWSLTRRRRAVEDYRSQLIRGLDGVLPDHPALRAFCDVVHEVSMPLDEPLRFLDAMEQDLSVSRYETYEALRAYMRGSAAAVGVMMCRALDANLDERTLDGAIALGEAMQLTNFLRDVGEDTARGRIYLPREDLARFGVAESDILNGRRSPAFTSLMQFEIARARDLYAKSEPAIATLPSRARRAVRLARILYSAILTRIEANDYDVFSHRAKTSRWQKVTALAQVIVRG